MTDRSALVRAVQEAARTDGRSLAAAVAALDAHDRGLRAQAAQDRELDLAGQHVARVMASGPMNGDRHTAATDWLADVADPRLDYRTAMAAEAAGWVRQLPREVLADQHEFTEQALGRARTAASAYGSQMQDAYNEFLTHVAYQSSALQKGAASGLPQIDQLTDPNNQPSQTPYPTEVFDTFGPETNEYNGGVEGDNHDSQVSSQNAPMIQQVEQMDGSGSGFGSGPEKPDSHTTGFDTSNSYAEVPLGPPGTIPSAGPGQGTSVRSTPSGVENAATPGTHAGEDEEQARGSRVTGAHYTPPDRLGYRWLASPSEVYHPFHEKCAASHWPDEDCTPAMPHVASVAIDHSMTLEGAWRIASCERTGAQEGLRAIAGARTSGEFLRTLAAHHNRLAQAWGGSDRSAEDTAVLRGFQAVVRPVLAEGNSPGGGYQQCSACEDGDCKRCSGGSCTCAHSGRRTAAKDSKICKKCASGSCKKCKGDGCTCSHPAMSRTAAGGYAAGGVSEKERRDAPHHLPGTDKFPIGSGADVENAKHDIGRTDEPHGKVVRYIDEMAREYGEAPVGSDRKAASRLDFPRGREAALSKGAPFAGYRDFADCVARNSDKNNPEAYCGSIKHQVEGVSQLPEIQQVLGPDGLPTPGTDVLPEGVMFPLTPGFGGTGDGTPGSEQQKQAARRSTTPSRSALKLFGRMDAMEGKKPHHKDGYPFGANAHGTYLRAWNGTRGGIDALAQRRPIPYSEYGPMTGRPDLHNHYLGSFYDAGGRTPEDSGWDQGQDASRNPGHTGTRRTADQYHLPDDDCRPAEEMPTGEHVGDQDHDRWDYGADNGSEDKSDRIAARRVAGQCRTCGRPMVSGDCGGCKRPSADCTCVPARKAVRRRADFMSQPHQSTDDQQPPFNSADTTPQPASQNASPQAADEQAGFHDGQEDALAGRRPTFMDNSSGVSGYVTGYTKGYSHVQPDARPDTGGHPGAPPQNPDVPGSMGGDSGQARNAEEAKQKFQVARASLGTSARFVTRTAARSPEFAKGYRFARRWQPGDRLVGQGRPEFEAGLYAGMTDHPRAQNEWIAAHATLAVAHPELSRRLERHRSFTAQLTGSGYALRANGFYGRLPKTAGTTTDLISDGPGTSPDPMGSTPLNGPGTPPPSGGRSDPARPGGPPPQNGAQPASQGPVVGDDEMGPAQQGPQPSGPLGQGFSGPGPGYGNQDQVPPTVSHAQDLAPAAPDAAAGPGYSNPGAYQGSPRGSDKVARMQAFRTTVGMNLQRMREGARA